MIQVVTFLFCILACLNSSAQKSKDETTAEKLDTFLISAKAAGKFNGTAIIAKKGQILLDKGYGFKNVAANSFNDSNSIFQIGSITKSFTAIIILKLQEEGKLSVQDKLIKFFPDYPQGDKISIHNLLTHTSGIYNYTNDIDENDTAIVCYPVSKDRVLEVFKNKPLAFKPGKYFQYCNSGYFLLGIIIEKVTGKPYETIVSEMIFNPLQMKHSGFDFKNLVDENKTQGYVFLTKDTVKTNYTIDSTVYYSAGAMYSTSTDMYKWVKAIANHELLNENSWKMALSPGKEGYGYGFWIKNTLYEKKCITHDGGLLGYTSDLIYLPDDDISIVLLSNTGDYNINLLFEIGMWLSAIVYNMPYSNWIATTTNVITDSALLNKFVGTYTSKTAGKMFIALRNGRLVCLENSQQATPETLTLIGETKFYFNDFNVLADLAKDKNGKIVKLIIHQTGKDIEFNKN